MLKKNVLIVFALTMQLYSCSTNRIQEEDLFIVWRYDSVKIHEEEVIQNYTRKAHIGFKNAFGRYLVLPSTQAVLDIADWQLHYEGGRNILEVTNSQTGNFDATYLASLEHDDGLRRLTLVSGDICLILISDTFSQGNLLIGD